MNERYKKESSLKPKGRDADRGGGQVTLRSGVAQVFH